MKVLYLQAQFMHLLPLPVFHPCTSLVLSDMSGKVHCLVPCIMRNWNLVLYTVQHQVALSLGTWDLCLFLSVYNKENQHSGPEDTQELDHTMKTDFQPLEYINQCHWSPRKVDFFGWPQVRQTSGTHQDFIEQCWWKEWGAQKTEDWYLYSAWILRTLSIKHRKEEE